MCRNTLCAHKTLVNIISLRAFLSDIKQIDINIHLGRTSDVGTLACITLSYTMQIDLSIYLYRPSDVGLLACITLFMRAKSLTRE